MGLPISAKRGDKKLESCLSDDAAIAVRTMHPRGGRARPSAERKATLGLGGTE